MREVDPLSFSPTTGSGIAPGCVRPFSIRSRLLDAWSLEQRHTFHLSSQNGIFWQITSIPSKLSTCAVLVVEQASLTVKKVISG